MGSEIAGKFEPFRSPLPNLKTLESLDPISGLPQFVESRSFRRCWCGYCIFLGRRRIWELRISEWKWFLVAVEVLQLRLYAVYLVACFVHLLGMLRMWREVENSVSGRTFSKRRHTAHFQRKRKQKWPIVVSTTQHDRDLEDTKDDQDFPDDLQDEQDSRDYKDSRPGKARETIKTQETIRTQDLERLERL